MTLSPTLSSPRFSVGESTAVITYLDEALPLFCEEIGVLTQDREHLISTALASAQASVKLMDPKFLSATLALPLPEARRFWNLIGDTLVSNDSEIAGVQHLQTALDYCKSGGNVVVVQNHRSGADTLVFETLIRRAFGNDICASFAYMSGHAVNLYLLPLMFCAALYRFQIFSVKTMIQGVFGVSPGDMRAQNVRTMRELARYAGSGGKILAYYPEGGRGDHCMKVGEPKTSCIPNLVSEAHNRKLLILPTYVNGAQSILPAVRGPHEYSEVFVHARKGTAHLNIGKPIPWNAITKLSSELLTGSDPWNKKINDTLLTLVARLGPIEQAGPYNPTLAYNNALIAPLMEGGLV